MKLTEALRIADECGLNTIEEAVRNIEIHAASYFDYSELKEELDELKADASNYNSEDSIQDILNGME